ncbi:hypothetical protein DL764_004863 [Monosporascus ibericus]|uniref:Uncharacterized protein n=1 Tax=Monosporascus ibericus TaxID=155417 RepID=A0A4Q4TDV2_9PEZI|nr:hypothetical protein DL764_004863 [Monosporascus ibericus]
MLRPSITSNAPREVIYIKNDIGPNTQISGQQGWAYDDGDFADVDLELVDVVPRSSWHEGRSVIIPTTESDGSTVSPTLVRLRDDKEGSPDFILILELKQQDTHVKAHHCVAICSRDTPSEELAGKLREVIQKAAGRIIASNGLLNLQLVLKPSAGQLMFTIRPEIMLCPPDVTVDATIKLLLKERADAYATWQLRRTLEGHKNWVQSVAFSHDSKLLASGSYDNTVRLWDPATGRLRQTLEGHKDQVQPVAFSHDSKLLASGSRDGTVGLWDPATGRLRRTLKGHKSWGHESPVGSVAFSHDSKLLASGSFDKTVRLWDPATGQLRRTLEGHKSGVQSVAFSHDSKLLASGSYDKTVRLWDPATGWLRQTLEGHKDLVQPVAFSHNSKLLASGSQDWTVWLWDPAMGQLRRTLEGHKSGVESIAFSHDSKLLASGSRDFTVQLWEQAVDA